MKVKIRIQFVLKIFRLVTYSIVGMYAPFITTMAIVHKVMPQNFYEWGFLIGINLLHFLGIFEVLSILKKYFFPDYTFGDLYRMIKKELTSSKKTSSGNQ